MCGPSDNSRTPLLVRSHGSDAVDESYAVLQPSHIKRTCESIVNDPEQEEAGLTGATSPTTVRGTLLQQPPPEGWVCRPSDPLLHLERED